MKIFDSFVDRHTGLNSKEDLQQISKDTVQEHNLML